MIPYRYGKASSLEQAAAFLAKGEAGSCVMAGGTDLLGEIKEGTIAPSAVIDLAGASGMSYIRKSAEGLAIGALTTVADLAEDADVARDYAVLHQAALSVASPQLRNRGTVGGNLCQRPRCWYYRDAATVCNKKGGGQCFAEKGRNSRHAIFGGGICYAVHPSDLAPALIVLEAKAVLVSAKGERTVPLVDFFTTPIVNVKRENVLAPDEVLKEVRVPPRKANDRSAYVKFIERGAWDFAVVSAAVKAAVSGSSMSGVRVVCGGVGTKPWRLQAAEQALEGARPDEAAGQRAAARSLVDARPLAENAYKTDLLKVIVGRAVAALAKS
jgi:xanthine dehydrogenase YagS FAD-binding subunit